MINNNINPIVSRIQMHLTCSTLIVCNYAKLPNDIYSAIMKNSFIANRKNERDMICVLPIDNELYTIWEKLVQVSSSSKVENIRL
jgi:hypothetical protein